MNSKPVNSREDTYWWSNTSYEPVRQVPTWFKTGSLFTGNTDNMLWSAATIIIFIYISNIVPIVTITNISITISSFP